MSANIALNDIVQVKIFCYLQNQVGLNVHYFQCTAVAGTSATYDAAAAAFDALFGPPMRAVISNGASYVVTHAQRVWPLPLLVASESSTNMGVGTNGPTALPTQVCGIITLKTANAGRAFRGRRYIPFPSTSADTGNGVPTAAYQTLLNVLSNGLDLPTVVGGGGNTATLTPVIFHKKTPSTPTPIVSALGVLKWATQRRRGLYGQTNSLPT